MAGRVCETVRCSLVPEIKDESVDAVMLSVVSKSKDLLCTNRMWERKNVCTAEAEASQDVCRKPNNQPRGEN